jgi:hypothetical protein
VIGVVIFTVFLNEGKVVEGIAVFPNFSAPVDG